MGGKLSLFIAAAGVLALVTAPGCGDSSSNDFYPDAGSPYGACEEGVMLDYSENQSLICDDLILGVEDLCGFDRTVDPCVCASAIGPCIADTDWLQLILGCRTSTTTCLEYIACLEGVGTSPTGCTDPTTWECIISSTDTDSQ